MADGESSVDELRELVRILERQLALERQVVDVLRSRVMADEMQVANLKIALTRSRRVGAAIGVLMATLTLSEDEAFDVLNVASQASGRTLIDIADKFLLTGTLQQTD